MRRSIIWIILIIFFTGCRLLPISLNTPNPIETEDILVSPSAFVTSTAGILRTQTPFSTVLPANTLTPFLTPTKTITPTILSTATRLPFKLQSVSPVYIKNFNHPDKGCDWLGVAGQVFDVTGNPKTNLVVVIKGILGEKVINSATLTGLKEANNYGPGGFEIILSDKVVGSTQSLFIYVNDINGNKLSPEIKFDTFSDCSKNLVIINFQAVE